MTANTGRNTVGSIKAARGKFKRDIKKGVVLKKQNYSLFLMLLIFIAYRPYAEGYDFADK